MGCLLDCLLWRNKFITDTLFDMKKQISTVFTSHNIWVFLSLRDTRLFLWRVWCFLLGHTEDPILINSVSFHTRMGSSNSTAKTFLLIFVHHREFSVPFWHRLFNSLSVSLFIFYPPNSQLTINAHHLNPFFHI